MDLEEFSLTLLWGSVRSQILFCLFSPGFRFVGFTQQNLKTKASSQGKKTEKEGDPNRGAGSTGQRQPSSGEQHQEPLEVAAQWPTPLRCTAPQAVADVAAVTVATAAEGHRLQ